LDPQQVISRATGHFQPCFPASRPVSRPVFASKLHTVMLMCSDTNALLYIMSKHIMSNDHILRSKEP
jgi:hypothetical protein